MAVVLLLSLFASAAAARWDAQSIAKHDVIKLRTKCGDEGEYSFPVWVVAVDNFVFVRLGSRAADRVQCTPGMIISVEAGGTRYDNIRGVPSPEMADRVNAAMAKKYTSDLLIRWVPHPLTLLLQP